MSIAPPREHADWQGEDVTVDEVVARLLRLNREHAHHAHGHGQTRTLNLIVAAGPDVPDGAVRARLEETLMRFPSRTLVLREHPDDRLDAAIEIDCAVLDAPGAAGYCHDAAVLYADEERLRHADSLVRPLLIAGLPSVLWLPGTQPRPCEAPLARIVDAVVLDSGPADVPREAFARAARLGAAAPVRDLAWMRLRRWRQRVAATFDVPQRLALLNAVERLEIRFGGPDAATPLLLLGWFAARAGWSIQRIGGAAETWSGTAQRGDGGRVALTLGSNGRDGAEHRRGIHELALHADGETLRVIEPVAEPGVAEAFAMALRTFDEPAPGYEPALAAIAQGLAAA
ncbi:MAG: hypothetical protein JWQ48_3732 [Conexibacter sp.]|nr:hypothetical protein [Conexibacter sp.]